MQYNVVTPNQTNLAITFTEEAKRVFGEELLGKTELIGKKNHRMYLNGIEYTYTEFEEILEMLKGENDMAGRASRLMEEVIPTGVDELVSGTGGVDDIQTDIQAEEQGEDMQEREYTDEEEQELEAELLEDEAYLEAVEEEEEGEEEQGATESEQGQETEQVEPNPEQVEEAQRQMREQQERQEQEQQEQERAAQETE